MVLYGGDVFLHASGLCQLFSVHSDELTVYVTVRQGVRYILIAAESCDQVFELVIGINGRFVWVLVISF